MSKFKKGDRVRVINKDGEFKVGDVFTVDRTAGNVMGVGGGNHFDKEGNCILGRDLELALPKNLKNANIKLKVTPKQSRRVQEICFENEVNWRDEDTFCILNTGWPALSVRNNVLRGWSYPIKSWCFYNQTEITYDQFMEQWGGEKEIATTLALPKNLKDANIKLKVTPEQSRRVQEICFENEVTWTTGDEVHNLEWPALHIEGKALTGYGTLTYAFIEDKVTEITYDQFMEQWGEKVKDQRVAFSTSTFTGIRMCIDCGQDHLTDTNILQKPKKGGLMSSLKKVTNFIKSLKQPLKNYVRLSWVEVEGDDFIVTSKGTEALEAVQFGLTDAKTLTEYSQMEVKRIKEEEAK